LELEQIKAMKLHLAGHGALGILPKCWKELNLSSVLLEHLSDLLLNTRSTALLKNNSVNLN